MIASLGTYLPVWKGPGGTRVVGGDEDAVTLAVAAGLQALDGAPPSDIGQVVLVTRDMALLEGGSAAALAAGLGLASDTDVAERVGGAPASLDAVLAAAPGTLVIGVDIANGAGAGAVLVSGEGAATLSLVGRVQRSLPLRVRTADGDVHQDEDPRLQRERGARASLDAASLPAKPLLIAGMKRREAAPFCQGDPPDLPTTGASAPFFALAALAQSGSEGLVAALEQATLSAAQWSPAGVKVHRDEPAAVDAPRNKPAPGPDIKIAFTAYDRAFESKVRWQAAKCSSCGTLSLPPRLRCLGCGQEGGTTLVALPRTGTVYTTTKVHVPVPGLTSPYGLAVVQLDGVDVRALVTVTGPNEAPIGSSGSLVLRRVATRSGVPDYGYAFCAAPAEEEA